MKITKKKLKEIIEKHKLWLSDEKGGERANLIGIDLSGADLSEMNLSNIDLSYTDLSHADLSDTCLRHANLSDACLRYANMSGVNLSNTYLGYANLSHANLSRSKFSYANFSCANFSRVDLSYAYLSFTDISYAYLSHTNLSYTKMDRVNLGGARLCNCIGNGREIKSLRLHEYTIVYTMDQLAIGCWQYPITDWFSTEYKYISMVLDQEFLDFWGKNKKAIKTLIKKYPAKEWR
jgi:hypothetical protein